MPLLFLSTPISVAQHTEYPLTINENRLTEKISGDGNKNKEVAKTVFAEYKIGLKSLAASLEHAALETTRDPHVGDTCCEIRAHFWATNAQAFSQCASNVMYETKALLEKFEKLESLFEQNLPKGNAAKGYTFLKFLEDHGLAVSINKLLKLAQLSCFLTKAKTRHFNFRNTAFSEDSLLGETIECANNPMSCGLEEKAFKKLIDHAQKQLATASVEYVQHELKELSVHEPIGLSQALLEDLHKAIGTNGCCINRQNKITAAYFPTLMTLYTRAAEKNIPIVLKIVRFQKNPPLFYKICKLYIPTKNIEYVAAEAGNIPRTGPALIIEAFSFPGSYHQLEAFMHDQQIVLESKPTPEELAHYKKYLGQCNFLKALWADATMHPQHAACKEADIEQENCVFKNKEQLKNLAVCMKELQQYAKEIGCCKKNMQLFYFKHIRAGWIQDHTKELEYYA